MYVCVYVNQYIYIYIYIYRVRFAGGDGGDFPPLWFTRPTLCWIIFILGGDKMYPPHPKYFHHYIVIINNQNTQSPCSFWLCCDFDLPGASQRRRARRKQFYFENQPDFLAFQKSDFEPGRFAKWREGREWLTVTTDRSIRCTACSEIKDQFKVYTRNNSFHIAYTVGPLLCGNFSE